MKVRYFLSKNGSPKQEVTKQEFMKAEQEAGFYSRNGGDEPATDGFSRDDLIAGTSVSGSITYEDITRED